MTGILLMVACLAFGQTPKVLVYNPYTKKGDLPPEWLKNKVTQQQYDSLARLSQHYAVSYAQFKQKQRKVNMREMNCKWLRMSNIS